MVSLRLIRIYIKPNTYECDHKYIAHECILTDNMTGDVESNIQSFLRERHSTIDHSHVTNTRIQSGPSWVIQNALREEKDNNWGTVYRQIGERDIQEQPNVIFSHVVSLTNPKRLVRTYLRRESSPMETGIP